MDHHPTVSLSVWLALVGGFAGSFSRVLNANGSIRILELTYRFAWLIGSVSVTFHILLSYWLVYDWSHADAFEATAEESERVTGIRAGWGVYVNFAFAILWIAYSIAMISCRVRWPWLDRVIFWFTAAIIASATIVFETGPVRWLSSMGFLVLLIAKLTQRRPTLTRNHS